MPSYETSEFEIKSKDFRDGTYSICDVSSDPYWNDVKAIERHWNRKGSLTSVTNHRERDFATACAELVAAGAVPISTPK